ncbi:hypothetical protein SPHINGOAX6_70093 [Sphingomonas sp. AX6]|nr:hypothetical protein SPHINGOAX6_70093 [Sphingomonas sp. AX6]
MLEMRIADGRRVRGGQWLWHEDGQQLGRGGTGQKFLDRGKAARQTTGSDPDLALWPLRLSRKLCAWTIKEDRA